MGRRMRPPCTACLLAAVAGLLALAPAAVGETALEQYQRTGRIDPCTAGGGAGDIPNDVEQYAPDFLDAYNAANRRGCKKAAPAPAQPDQVAAVAAGEGRPPGATFVPKPPAPPQLFREERVVRHAPLAIEGDTRIPAPILALAVMVALGLLGAALAAAARRTGWGPDRLARRDA